MLFFLYARETNSKSSVLRQNKKSCSTVEGATVTKSLIYTMKVYFPFAH